MLGALFTVDHTSAIVCIMYLKAIDAPLIHKTLRYSISVVNLPFQLVQSIERNSFETGI